MKTLKARLLIAILIADCLFLSSAAFAQETGTWVAESQYNFTPRSDLSSAVVNGKIYVMGGDYYGAPTNILEVYDPVTNLWSTPVTTGTFTARDSHTSAVVNGKIYVMGGYDASSPNAMTKLEVFDPATNTWSAPATTGTFTGRGGLSSAVVNGKIYVMGGSHSGLANTSNTLEVFDPATNSWSTPVTTGTFSPRSYFTSQVVNGKIYTMGGTNSSGIGVNTFEVFDPATNTWSTPATAGTFSPRADLASSVINGKIYAIGGHKGVYVNTFEEFDPATNAWSTPNTTGTVTARNALTAGTVNGTLYALGGSNGNDLNTNEAYTPYAAAPPPGTLSLHVSQLNFGVHDYTKDSALAIMVFNPSTTAVSVDQVMVAGTNATDFKVPSNTKLANLPYQLHAGDSIGFVIQYSAPSVTESDNAILQILFDGSPDSVRTVALSGSAQKPASPKPGYITLSVGQLDFGANDYTKDSALTVMIHNPSTTPVSIDQTSFAGANPTDFKVLSNTKQVYLPYQLNAGDSIGFTIQYIAPSATESDNAILRILFDQTSDSVRSITLSGSSKKPVINDVTVLSETGLLFSIYPNPATSEIHAHYSIPNHSSVIMTLYDITGKEVKPFTSETQNAGTYEKLWDVRTLTNGSYFMKISACGESVTRVVQVMK
jgi:N-acetylneuraminic acid mutarotase